MGRVETWWRRGLTLIGWALAGTLALAVAIVSPNLLGVADYYDRHYIPHWIRTLRPWVVTAAVAVFLQARPARLLGRRMPEGTWERLDAVADRVLGRWLAPGLGLAVAAMFATWVPHYLTWPWWPDTDHFALAALSWDAGVVPYRDTLDYNFPGPTYVMWALGKLAGWGKTAPAYALDAALLAGLALAIVYWGRRRFGRALPGWVGAALVVGTYLSFDYSRVGERDWTTSTFVVLGLTALQSLRGWPGRLASALATAVALAYRPYAVHFVPALVSAVEENARQPGEPARLWLRPAAGWALAVGAFLALAAAPLFWSGVADDFVRDLAYLRPGGPYNRLTAARFFGRLVEGFQDLRFGAALIGCLAAALAGPAELRRSARTWVLALLAAVCYRPVSPVDHYYLVQPLWLVGSVGLAFALGVGLSLPRVAAPLKLFATGLVLLRFVPWFPPYCSVGASVEAVATMARGERPSGPPFGCSNTNTFPKAPWYNAYTWDDYAAVLDYLRRTTDRGTAVANVLRRHPFPALNGPTGRLSPFPCVDGILWLRWVGPAMEADFIRALERSERSVVVWAPDENVLPPHDLPGLTAAIRRLYRPEARFGMIEVWSRRPAPSRSAP